MRNEYSQNNNVTQAFHPPNYLTENDWQKLPSWQLLAQLIAMIAVFGSGFIISKILWPTEKMIETRHILLTKSQPPAMIPAPPQEENKQHLEVELDRLVDARMKDFFKNCKGILDIKDGEAQTVRYKRAAIGNKEGGFTDLETGTPYPVLAYHNHANMGIGIAKYDKTSYFFFRWQHGKVLPPLKISGNLTAPKGLRIEINGN